MMQRNAAVQGYAALKRNYLAVLAVLLIPTIISLLLYFTYREKGTEKQVVLVQPNINPYTEKFDPGTLEQQLQTMFQLSAEKTDQQTDYLVLAGNLYS
jgi:apolipoprotein N-acyltransferase